MDVDDHDAAVARVSHLPHLMSVLMAGHLVAVPDGDLLLAGQGLRDVTRIAGSDPQLWEQIVGANSAAVLGELRGVQDQLTSLIAGRYAGERLAVPVRFLVGDQDFLFEEDMIHAATPHTDAEYRGDVLRGVGHFIPDEAKDELREIVLDYLGASALTQAP